jgi:hypothetical protein
MPEKPERVAVEGMRGIAGLMSSLRAHCSSLSPKILPVFLLTK